MGIGVGGDTSIGRDNSSSVESNSIFDEHKNGKSSKKKSVSSIINYSPS